MSLAPPPSQPLPAAAAALPAGTRLWRIHRTRHSPEPPPIPERFRGPRGTALFWGPDLVSRDGPGGGRLAGSCGC